MVKMSEEMLLAIVIVFSGGILIFAMWLGHKLRG
jgi:hypothetical protein